jgi:hypothetical protein
MTLGSNEMIVFFTLDSYINHMVLNHFSNVDYLWIYVVNRLSYDHVPIELASDFFKSDIK